MGNSRKAEICEVCTKMYEVFEQLCQSKGVTPNQVSVATGIRSSAFTDWKHGRSIPKTDKLIKIADYFHVPLDYLLTGNSQAQNNDEIRILFTRTEAIHSMVSEFAVDGDQRTIDLVYSILQREWTDEQLDLLIGYCDKLNDDQRWFVNTIIARELQK